MSHTIDTRLLNQTVHVALVGAGGNGCQMLSGLARLDRAMRAVGHPGGLHVTMFDPDKVSEANVGRQLFSPADIGLNKAVVLVHRVNGYFGLDWDAAPVRFTKEHNSRPSFLDGGGWSARTSWDMLITCVDSAKARRDIHKVMMSSGFAYHPLYWLDMGNRQQDGQVVLGEIYQDHKSGTVGALRKAVRLPTVVDVFPELLDAKLPEDNRPSCSLAEALESQDLFINQAVVTWGLQLLWKLFREGKIEHHGYFINLKDGRVNPLAIASATKKRRAA